MNDERIKKEVLEDYYDEKVLEWYLVDHIGSQLAFLSIILTNRAEILPYTTYLRHEKLINIIK